MRAIWKGAVSFGLVSIAVKLYSATEEKDIRFHQVHKTDGGRIKYKRTCSVDGEEVTYDDIAKGYDLGGGEMVILTDDDFADLPLTTSRAIDVLEFVPAEQVDPILYNKAYYLEPESSAAKPYTLLRDALTRTDRVAIVKVALRQREQLATLRVRDGVLVLNTMLWPDEVRKASFDFLDEDVAAPAGRTGDGRLADRVDGGRLRPGAVHRQLPGRAPGGHRREGGRPRGRSSRRRRNRSDRRGGPDGGAARLGRAGPDGARRTERRGCRADPDQLGRSATKAPGEEGTREEGRAGEKTTTAKKAPAKKATAAKKAEPAEDAAKKPNAGEEDHGGQEDNSPQVRVASHPAILEDFGRYCGCRTLQDHGSWDQSSCTTSRAPSAYRRGPPSCRTCRRSSSVRPR
jgi:DNA end-binding protein Ku